MLDKAYHQPEDKSLPLSLPGEALPFSQELTVKVYYTLCILAGAWMCVFLGSYLFTFYGLVYALVVSALLQGLSMTRGIDRILVDLSW